MTHAVQKPIYSSDGHYIWNGEKWSSTQTYRSADGQWWWDGGQWRSVVPLTPWPGIAGDSVEDPRASWKNLKRRADDGRTWWWSGVQWFLYRLPVDTLTSLAEDAPSFDNAFISLHGGGSHVVPNINLHEGEYTLQWTAGRDDVSGQFIVVLHGAPGSDICLVDEFLTEDTNGEAYLRAGEGVYTLEFKGKDLIWGVIITPPLY